MSYLVHVPACIFSMSSHLLRHRNSVTVLSSISLESGFQPLPNFKGTSLCRHARCSSDEQNASTSTLASGDDDPKMDPTTEASPRELGKELQKAVRNTAATFAPRASVARKNPAIPGTTLYAVFEVQAYLSMALGGALSFNLFFPSNEPDILRLMGMWSIWMFTIPSLRARDCSSKEKDALNYLFLVIPLINVLLPLLWKSFSLIWTTDVLVFFAMYAWKLDLLTVNKGQDA